MAIAMTLKQYLDDHHVAYEVMTHRPEMTTTRVAQACHVPGNTMAKAVILTDGDDYLMAVVPSTHHLKLGAVSRMLGRSVGLAHEEEAMSRFPDCETGAFPPLGPAYGMSAIYDDSLMDLPELYLEGGDHRCVVHMARKEFGRLVADAPHGAISVHD